jgi:hypothetical protein
VSSAFDADLDTGWYDDDLIGVYFNESSRNWPMRLKNCPFASAWQTEVNYYAQQMPGTER